MTTYITVKQLPQYRQMTIEELLFGTEPADTCVNDGIGNTRTFVTENYSTVDEYMKFIDPAHLIEVLRNFNNKVDCLRQVPRSSLYHSFSIPKRTGGLRRIDAPNEQLMEALRELKTILETEFHALYHTSAFAYVKERSTISAVKRHQMNESKWFAKYDLTNFFGSITLPFTMQILAKIFPFSVILRSRDGKIELEKALELGFLNGGLPQGTPLSPMLTNLIMIPIDHTLANALRDYNGQRFVYTRYADDFQISSRFTFQFREIESLIVRVLHDFNAPFRLKPEKTRYGSANGANWNLGVMLNKDNEITVGHRNKKIFQAMLHNYIHDRANGIFWELNDVQTLEGYRNYYSMVEKDTINRIIEHTDRKFNVNVRRMIAEDLRR